MLELKKTTKRFVGGEVVTTALNAVSLQIKGGEYVAVVGPSGCGKSTLLSILGLLDSPDEGEYWFDGQNV
ncbi:MAG TPA: ATP-binding cassette domain-containing protein, partial [Steroidobacteraceae bacterium]